MPIQYIHKPSNEPVEKENWRWVAIYNDQTILKQFDDEKKEFHQFKEIDQSKLFAFRMESDDPNRFYTLLFNPKTMKLIHFYRRYRLNVGTPQFKKLTAYCFGYETKNGKHLMFLMPNGELVITDDDSKFQIT